MEGFGLVKTCLLLQCLKSPSGPSHSEPLSQTPDPVFEQKLLLDE